MPNCMYMTNFTDIHACPSTILFFKDCALFFVNFYVWRIEFTNETCKKIIISIFLTLKATILDTWYRVCHGFRLTLWVAYFWVNFDPFWSKHLFLMQLGSVENWLQSKAEPPSGNLTCPNLWNALLCASQGD